MVGGKIMIVNEDNYRTLKKACELLSTNYEIKWFDAENIDGYIDADEMLGMIEDLVYEVETQKMKYNELKEEVNTKYEEDLYQKWKDDNLTGDYYGHS